MQFWRGHVGGPVAFSGKAGSCSSARGHRCLGLRATSDGHALKAGGTYPGAAAAMRSDIVVLVLAFIADFFFFFFLGKGDTLLLPIK
jgi:hypothetical protein